jgi:hypothetical protein
VTTAFAEPLVRLQESAHVVPCRLSHAAARRGDRTWCKHGNRFGRGSPTNKATGVCRHIYAHVEWGLSTCSMWKATGA